MKRLLAVAAVGAALAGISATAAAHGRIGFSVSIGAPVYAAPPVYYAPPPVAYAPPPVYYAPPPVYYAPPPQVYYAPARAYYGPPVATFYYGRAYHHRGHARRW
jgi:hypothetical protein